MIARLAEGVRLLPIADHPTNRHWELHLAWNPEHLDPAARAFLRMARQDLAVNPWLLQIDPSGLATPEKVPL